jgi:hypothetical protein
VRSNFISAGFAIWRSTRIQRNHIACALLAWGLLKSLAYKTGQTIYHLKLGHSLYILGEATYSKLLI